MKTLRSTLLLFASLAFLAGCGGDDDEPTTPQTQASVNPSDPNALSQVLVIPGSTSQSGSVPEASDDAAAPQVSSSSSTITSSNGSTVNVPLTYDNVQTNLGGCYVQVEGSNTYFRVPYNSNSGNSGAITIPITIPTNVTSGNFSLYYCVYDASGLVSNPLTADIEVLALGSGDLQISLSWDTDGNDVDLYVAEPGGETISYQNRTSESGGALDRDDTNGFGPENIFWEDGAPDGTYSVSVNYFSGGVPTNYTVTVNGVSTSRTFTGSLETSGETDQVVTFTKSGSNINF